ncbi:hypothetical protein HS125_09605 [bacterium]|nr:hypothetical protein [bacterium]
MNEGFMLASKVLKRQITLEEGLVSAIARDQVANFANSFNAILGRNVLSRYQCEAMVSSRSFPTLDQLVEASEAEAATEQPELDLEPLFPQSEPPAAQTPPQGADVEPPAAASEGEEVPSCPPADPDAAPSAEPRPMLDLHALETSSNPVWRKSRTSGPNVRKSCTPSAAWSGSLPHANTRSLFPRGCCPSDSCSCL